MIRFAHFSDVHLGYRNGTIIDQATGRNQRAVDIEESFIAACRRIAWDAPDFVIHAGDIFHSSRPSWDAVDCFIRGMQALEGIPAILIAGNHDMSRLRQSSTVFDVLRSALSGVTLVTGYEPMSVEVGGAAVVHCLPHGALQNGAGVSGTFWPNPDAYNILVAHGMASNLPTLGDKEPGEMEVSDELLSDQWSYICLGHYHRHGKVRARAWYSGATERMGFSDEPSTPGWNLVTIDGLDAEPVVERREVRARPMRTLPEVRAGLGAEWEAVQRKLVASLGSVERDDRATMNARIPLAEVSLRMRSLAKDWLDKQNHGYWSLSLAVGKAKPKRIGAERNESEVEAVAMPSTDELLREYVGGIKQSDEFKVALLERGGTALARAAEMAGDTE